MTRPDDAALPRELHAVDGVGIAAHVLQGAGLKVLRSRVEQPALVFVDRGIKSVRAQRGNTVRARAGQALALGGNQTVDFTNDVTEGTQYEARWLVFDAAVLDDASYVQRCEQLAAGTGQADAARLVSPVRDGLASAFERARQALGPQAGVPAPVARQRLLEVLHWLLEDGIVLRSAPVHPGVSTRVRALVARHLGGPWPADRVAGELALSQSTLRRRLAEEDTSLTDLLAEARMSAALTLLQATSRPVADIAQAVGYESPSRFAVRFRQRFGFAPTAVRGHERAA